MYGPQPIWKVWGDRSHQLGIMSFQVLETKGMKQREQATSWWAVDYGNFLFVSTRTPDPNHTDGRKKMGTGWNIAIDECIFMCGRERHDNVDVYHPSTVDEQKRGLMHTGRRCPDLEIGMRWIW